MQRNKLIGYGFIAIFPLIACVHIYMSHFSSYIKEAQKNSHKIYTEVAFPEKATYLEELLLNKSWRSCLFVTGTYNEKDLSKEEIEAFYRNKLKALGWKEVDENIYRKNTKEWFKVSVNENKYISLRILTYILEYDSDKGLETLR